MAHDTDDGVLAVMAVAGSGRRGCMAAAVIEPAELRGDRIRRSAVTEPR